MGSGEDIFEEFSPGMVFYLILRKQKIFFLRYPILYESGGEYYSSRKKNPKSTGQREYRRETVQNRDSTDGYGRIRVNPGIPEEIQKARENEADMNLLIEKNKKFIITSAYRAVNHYVTESDDEWSIALIAFHEAVLSYEEEKGNFQSFAALVIRRRLLDYLRSEGRHAGEIAVEPAAFSGEKESGEELTPLEMEIRKKEVSRSLENEADSPILGQVTVKDEIEAVQKLLGHYGFSFFDLADCSPKAEKTKRKCADAVAALLKDPALFQKMRETGTLPIKEISERAGVMKKILERHRKYIIAAAEILNGEYPLLAEYMNYIRKALSP